jgi:hypothetical protein
MFSICAESLWMLILRQWEKGHGRVCLPAMFLHPIKNIVKPSSGNTSKSELPFQ